MNDAQHRVAVLHCVHQHPHGNQVVNLVEGLALTVHLFVNGIKMLGPSVHLVMNVLLVQLFGQLGDHTADAFFPFHPALAHLLGDVVKGYGVDILEAQILQLGLDGIDAQPVRQRRVNIQRFVGDGLLPVLRLKAQGAHVVQPVGQLDHHHPDVLGHGQDHLAQAFGLLFLPVGEIQLVQLGHAVHQLSHFVAELLPDGVQRNAGTVLHGIVQEPGGNGGRVDHQIGQDAGHGYRVNEVGLAAFAHLPGVGLLRELIRFFHQKIAVSGVLLLHPGQHFFQRHAFVGDIGKHRIPPLRPALFSVLRA